MLVSDRPVIRDHLHLSILRLCEHTHGRGACWPGHLQISQTTIILIGCTGQEKDKDRQRRKRLLQTDEKGRGRERERERGGGGVDGEDGEHPEKMNGYWGCEGGRVVGEREREGRQ